MTNSDSIFYSDPSLAQQLPGPHIWLLEFAQVDATAEGVAVSLLSDDERRKAQQYTRGQREFIACRALLRLCLAQYTGANPKDLRFGKTPSGKPYLLAPWDDWQFNLSHTNQYAAVAVMRGSAIGVDIEHPRKRNFLGIAANYFHPDELAYLNALPATEVAQDFLRLWTLKEAFFKALGGGIATGLHLARFSLDGTDAHVQLAAELGESVSDWQFYHQLLQLPQLTQLALACKSADTLDIHWFKGLDLFLPPSAT
jgi:4'-phosphopantetheinyl transferase